jgi:hypothetical protein
MTWLWVMLGGASGASPVLRPSAHIDGTFPIGAVQYGVDVKHAPA